jgi:hypothetical protein
MTLLGTVEMLLQESYFQPLISSIHRDVTGPEYGIKDEDTRIMDSSIDHTVANDISPIKRPTG